MSLKIGDKVTIEVSKSRYVGLSAKVVRINSALKAYYVRPMHWEFDDGNTPDLGMFHEHCLKKQPKNSPDKIKTKPYNIFDDTGYSETKDKARREGKPTPAKKAKKPRKPMSEAHKAKLRASLAKARAAKFKKSN